MTRTCPAEALSSKEKRAACLRCWGGFGRSGIILHPVLGSRLCLATILTDAQLEPDPKRESFNPCENCAACVNACPASAYDKDKFYPESWTRETCLAKRAQIEEEGLYCHNCFAACPAGTIADEDLLTIKEARSCYKQARRET